MHHAINISHPSHMPFPPPGMPFQPCLLGEVMFILQMASLVDSFKESLYTRVLISFPIYSTFAVSPTLKYNHLFACPYSLLDWISLEQDCAFILFSYPQCLAHYLRCG